MNTLGLICSLSFKFGTTFASLQELFSALTCPKIFAILLENVSDPQVVFALCLALKQSIKKNNTKTALLATISKDKQDQVVLSEHRPLFKINTLWIQIQKTMEIKAKEKKNSTFQPVSPFSLVNQEYYGKDSEVNKWCMQMNYLYLLLESLKSIKSLQNLTQYQLQVQLATAKLRDEVISKLIFDCLIIQEKLPPKFKMPLDVIFLQIQKCLPEDKGLCGYRVTNILQQMMNYSNRQAYFTRWMKIANKFGRQITNLTISLFGLFADTESKDIIDNFLEIVSQLFNLHKTKHQPSNQNQENLRSGLKEPVYQDNQVLPSYLQSKCCEFIQMIQTALLILLKNDQNIPWQSIAKINEIVSNISLGSLSTCVDPFSKDFKLNIQKIGMVTKETFNLYELIAGKSFSKLQYLQDESQVDFYYEFSFVQKIMKAIYRNFNYSITESNLVQFMMVHYFPLLIQKVKISFENGGNNPINIMFFYFHRIMIILQKKNQNQHIIYQIKHIVNLFILKCAQARFTQKFEDFFEENSACYEYFKSLIGLFVELQKYAQKTQQLSQFTLLYQSIDNILTSQRKTGHYLLRFTMQLLRTCQSHKKSSQEFLQMMIFLLQRLKLPGFYKQYLIILDIVSNHLIDSQAFQFDQSLSDLWYYIMKNNSNQSFKEFTNKLGTELINILVTQKEMYFTSYCISVICRTCKKLEKVEKNRVRNILYQQKFKPNDLKPKEKLINHRESLIKRYLFAVYEFFTNLEKSKLNELGHFEKRSQFLQIIGFLGVGTMEDVYIIFNESIMKNLTIYGQESSLYFLTDTSGLIVAHSKKLFRTTFIQLVLSTLKLNPQIMAKYNVQTLNSNQLYFKVFYDFIIALNFCCAELSFKHSCVIIDFFNSIQPIINQLHTIYSTDNYEEICQIWQTYIEGGSPKGYLPLLPQKLYNTQSSVGERLLTYYCNNLFRIQTIQQVQIVFRNVFERKNLDWCNYESEKMQSNIIPECQAPKMLLLFADYVQISNLGYFFDYQSVVKTIVKNMYSLFVKKISVSPAVQDISNDQDDASSESQVYITHVDEFFITRQYVKGVRQLARAHHIFAYAATGEEVDFVDFEAKFFEELKEMLRHQKF